MKKLLIVESPGKIKKIKKYLGDSWDVKASVGHICDLPKKELGIDKANNFKPTYVVSEDKKNVIKDLSFAIKSSGKDNVYLATDEDREGEAISFHICRNLGLDYRTTKRVTFNEITEKAILAAIQKPRTIDIPLVSAQEARRVIDRLVGFEISPILWKKIKSDTPLSAGRVQSVAVKLVVEREKDILNFQSNSTFKVSGQFLTPGSNILKASASFSFKTAEEAKQYLLSTQDKTFSISSVAKEPKKTNPSAPFSTSTLQQDANKKLKFPVVKTMEIAQKLYEAGHITYMRTDSVNLSETAIEMLSEFIKKTYGNDYLEVRKFKNKNESAQEAHEAIRPTNFDNPEIDASEDEKALYALIYMRAVASQMRAKETDITTITIAQSSGEIFQAKASLVTFDGFTRAYSEIEEEESNDEDEEAEIKEALKSGDKLELSSIVAKESFTKPKARFSEAELVKELEAKGIGRPSTYGSILKNIKDVRKYIQLGKVEGKKLQGLEFFFEKGNLTEKKINTTIGQASGKLIPNDIAFTLIDFLEQEFSRVMDYQFTANCEDNFDKIASGKDKYVSVVREFYSELSSCLSKAESNHDDVEGRQRKTTDLGVFENKQVSVGKGEHGVYIRHNDKFYNVADATEPDSVNLDLAIKIITEKREADKKRKEEKEANTLHVFGKFKVIQGQYGPYITNGKDTAPFPKWDLDKMAEYDEAKCKEAVKNYKAFKKKKKK